MRHIYVDDLSCWDKSSLIKALSGARDGDIFRAPDGTIFTFINPSSPRPSCWDPLFRSLLPIR